MRSLELGPAGSSRNLGPTRVSGVIHSVVSRFVYPVQHPFQTLTLYYAVLIGLAALLIYFVPASRAMISGERLAELVGSGGNILTNQPNPAAASRQAWMTTVDMALGMIGALLLMLPTSWVYMAERRRKGFDQAMVQTMIVLAVAIAGVVVIVRNSTALAFSLAGIVAAVRFRNNLSDTRDTL